MATTQSIIQLGEIQYKKTSFVAGSGSGVSGPYEQTIYQAPSDVLSSGNRSPFYIIPAFIQITCDNTSTNFTLFLRQFRRDYNDTAYARVYNFQSHSGAVTSSLTVNLNYDFHTLLNQIQSEMQGIAVPTGAPTTPTATDASNKAGAGILRLAPKDEFRIGGDITNLNGTITVLTKYLIVRDTRFNATVNEWY